MSSKPPVGGLRCAMRAAGDGAGTRCPPDGWLALKGPFSGGEQQMLALARALMGRPRVLLLDAPSMGLAPVLVDLVFETIRQLHAQGTTILLVEQNARDENRI